MNKKGLSEADIKAKFITPAILKAGWDELTQLGREASLPTFRKSLEEQGLTFRE